MVGQPFTEDCKDDGDVDMGGSSTSPETDFNFANHADVFNSNQMPKTSLGSSRTYHSNAELAGVRFVG
eukprot:15470734-Alexandrium_andersonii.AAC.1